MIFIKIFFPLKDVLTNFLSGCGQMELKKQDLQPEKLRLTKRKFPQLWMSSLVSDTGDIESFFYYSTLNFEILAALVFQLEVYYNVDRLLTGLSAQQIGTTARWYSNNTPLLYTLIMGLCKIAQLYYFYYVHY